MPLLPALLLAIAFGGALGWWSYRGRLDAPLSRVAAACRAIGAAALLFVVLDPTVAARFLPTRPLVLLDNSISMHAAAGRATEARELARTLGDTTTFGELSPGMPGSASRLADVLPTALASGRPCPSPLDEAEDRQRPEQGDGEGPPEVRADQPEPGEMDEGRAQQRHEEPVAARGLEAQEADAGRAAVMARGMNGFSLAYNRHLARWVAVYGEILGNRVFVRTAPAPEGPYGAATLAFEAPRPAVNNIYGVAQNPALSDPEGCSLLVSWYNPLGEASGEMRVTEVTLR